MLGRAMTFEIRAQQLVIGSYSLFGIGIELALSLLSEAAANFVAEADSAANQYGRQTAENPR
jgi:hypothetical protein